MLVLRVRETSNSWRPASEIEVAEAILVDQSFAHETEEKSKPRPFQKPGRIGHPEKPNRSLGVDVLEWYHPTVRVPQWETCERVGHPPGVDDKVLTRFITDTYKYKNGQHYEETTPHNPWDN